MNTDAHTVTVADMPVRLTQTEYAILKLLMANPSQVITKSVMLDRISEDTPDVEANGTPSPIRRLFFFKKQFNSFL